MNSFAFANGTQRRSGINSDSQRRLDVNVDSLAEVHSEKDAE